jgi:cytochrome c oxidase subunit 2
VKAPRTCLLPLAALLAGCRGIQAALDPAGEQARVIGSVWDLMMVVCGFMFALVLLFIGWMLWRARRGRGLAQASEAAVSPHERGLDLTLRGWSALIVAGLFVLAAGSFLADRKLAALGTQPALHVRITAQQWWWQVEYQNADASQTLTTANELHLPVDRPTEIELKSADVIHSFWVPNLNGKTDLIPGRTNHTVVTPRRLGRLRGQCAEFCGLQHAHMALDVSVEDAASFEHWRRQQLQSARAPMTPSQQAGADFFMHSACAMCHTIAGTQAGGKTGPDLTHLASRRSIAAGTLPMNRGSLAAWIADPQSQKPGTNMPTVDLTPDQLNALVDYLMALK